MKDIPGITAELLELGEMLFDTAIDAAEQRPGTGEASDAEFIEEMRAAAGEFFTVMRLLLETRERGRITSVIFRSV